MASSEDKSLILVVEDDQVMAEGISDILSVAGYRVETACSGKVALMKMQAETPDLVLSDIMMPEMNGHDFCRLVRSSSEWRTVPFIFLTALGQRDDQRLGLELGADAYLTKPYEPDDLLLAVRARLQRAADHRKAADAALADLRASILTALNHEFRTPLTYITGYGHMLAEDGQRMDSETFQQCVAALLEGAARLRRLVENVLLYSQIESGELAALIKMFPLKTSNLYKIACDLIRVYQPEVSARQLQIHNRIAADLPSVAMGEDHVRQVLDHLVDNAIKFSRTGGNVILSASYGNRHVDLAVADEGVGIQPDALASVFDSFRQVDREKLEQQGAGLGLAIVRGLVETHNGSVTITSEPGVGTTVTVRLPVVDV